MKIKLFEEYNKEYLAFDDEYLSIHKILHGSNKGKIHFLFHDSRDPLIFNNPDLKEEFETFTVAKKYNL